MWKQPPESPSNPTSPLSAGCPHPASIALRRVGARGPPRSARCSKLTSRTSCGRPSVSCADRNTPTPGCGRRSKRPPVSPPKRSGRSRSDRRPPTVVLEIPKERRPRRCVRRRPNAAAGRTSPGRIPGCRASRPPSIHRSRSPDSFPETLPSSLHGSSPEADATIHRAHPDAAPKPRGGVGRVSSRGRTWVALGGASVLTSRSRTGSTDSRPTRSPEAESRGATSHRTTRTLNSIRSRFDSSRPRAPPVRGTAGRRRR